MAEIVVKSDLQKTHKKVENKVVPRIAVIVTKRALDNHKNVLTFASMLKKSPRKLLKTVHKEQNNLESVHGEDITEIQFEPDVHFGLCREDVFILQNAFSCISS